MNLRSGHAERPERPGAGEREPGARPAQYMLFIVNSNGVPSVAYFVSLPVGAVPTKVAVPNVVNQTQAAAPTAITAAGLTVGAITTATSATVPRAR